MSTMKLLPKAKEAEKHGVDKVKVLLIGKDVMDVDYNDRIKQIVLQ